MSSSKMDEFNQHPYIPEYYDFDQESDIEEESDLEEEDGTIRTDPFTANADERIYERLVAKVRAYAKAIQVRSKRSQVRTPGSQLP